MEREGFAGAEAAAGGYSTDILEDNIPIQLREHDQWVAWRIGSRGGRATKIPINPANGSFASSTDPRTWATFDQALRFARMKHGHGVGWVVTLDSGIVGVDLDKCISLLGEVAPWARDIANLLRSYTEVTPSGRGLRIFVRGKLPPTGRKRGKVEIYDRSRFLTVTGRRLELPL